MYNVQRLLTKFETAKELVPQPIVRKASTADEIRRHLFRLDQPGDERGASTRCKRKACTSMLLRVRAFPFSAAVDLSSSPRTTPCSSSSRTATRSCARC